jgi:hypothetical protein
MPVATNMGQLRKMIQDEMKQAMNEAHSKIEADMKKELSEFYSQGSPKIYVRTGALGQSSRTTGISGGGNTLSFEAYLEPPSYTVPNMDFVNRGFPSRYSGKEVLSAAESHSSHILGKGGFWSRILKDIKTDLMDSMNSHFS